MVRCLLEAGKVDVDATDRKGATALMYAGNVFFLCNWVVIRGCLFVI